MTQDHSALPLHPSSPVYQPQRENFLSWRYWFGEYDTRWLAVFRILLALLILKDAIYHLPLARVFYSDAGIIPRANLYDGLLRDQRFSLMDAVGAPWMATLFFVVWILILVGVLLGYRTRWMVILNFIMILSVHERNTQILTSADTLMRVMCFWMMFIPVGQYYSIDALWRRWRTFRDGQQVHDLQATQAPQLAFAFPIRILQWQLIIVYAVTAYLKAIGDVWQAGQALHYVKQLNTMLTPFGMVLQHMPDAVLTLMTYFSLYAEMAIPILLIVPFFWRPARLGAFALGILLHGGILVLMSIADFSLVILACYVTFFDPAWMLWLERQFKRTPRTLITLAQPNTADSPLWTYLACFTPQQVTVLDAVQQTATFDSWQVQVDDQVLRGQAAWRAMSAHLPFSRIWDWSLRFAFVRRMIWAIMARISTRFHKKPYLHSPKNVTLWTWQRLALYLILLPMFIIVIWWNVAQVGEDADYDIPNPPGVSVLWYTGMWQYWNMFAPLPVQHDGWLVIIGQFEDGTEQDLITEQAFDIDTPTRWYWGPDLRYEKFEEGVFFRRYDAVLRGWGDYYCRTVNHDRAEGTRLATMQIEMIYTPLYAPGETPNAYRPEKLWQHWCYAQYAPDYQAEG